MSRLHIRPDAREMVGGLVAAYRLLRSRCRIFPRDCEPTDSAIGEARGVGAYDGVCRPGALDI